MAVESPSRNAEELRDMTRQWLRDAPAGGMDGGDRRRRRRHRRGAPQRARLRRVVRAVRRGGIRDADVAGRVRRRAVALARRRALRQRGAQPLQGAAPVQHHRHRHGRPDGDGVGDRGDEAPAAAAAGVQPGDLVPAVQRARRRLGRRRARDPGGARRRRVGRQRPEGVDHGRAPLEVGDAAVPHEPGRARSTAGFRTSSSTWSSPASRCDRWCRSPATPSSTRCSSTTPASATTGCSAARATAGRSRSRRS